jgi:enoyl-CoA hydratase/carnithine racemase
MISPSWERVPAVPSSTAASPGSTWPWSSPGGSAEPAYRAVKTVLAAAATSTLDQTLALEARLQTALGETEDHRAAVEAFLAKRQPSFAGR